jgi:hypothetical protein
MSEEPGMDYVEWVEKVLQAAVEALTYADAVPYEFNGMPLLHIGGELGFGPEDLQSSDPTKPGKAVLNALIDLADLGFVEQQGTSNYFKLTREGRRAAQAGLSTMWGPLTSTPLDDDQIEALAKVVQGSQVDYGSYVGLQEVTLWDIQSPSEGPNDGMIAFRLLHELDDKYQMVRSRSVAGLAKALPTYKGVVRLTRPEESKLQALIRDLLADGENVNVDFKQEVHLQTKAQKGEFIKDLLALVTTKARGERYMLIGFDDKTGAFVKSVDPTITKDRIEDLLIAYTEPVPSVRYDTTTWEGGTVGLIEVIREAHKLPYRVKVDIGEKLKAGEVLVRHGSHTVKLKPSDEEYQDLVAEGNRARLT